MAAVFQFKTGTTTTIDMLTGDLRVDGDKYVPAPSPEIPGDGSMPPDIVEVIPFILTASSDNALATDLQTLDGLKVTAANYRNNSHIETAFWWHHQLPTETGARRALVKKFDYQLDKYPDGALTDRLKGIPGTITLTRAPYWEATTTQSWDAATFSVLNFDGGNTEFTLGETITGATTGHTAIVMGYLLRTGAWNGTAIGYLYLKDASSTFQDDENITGSVGGSSMAVVNGVLTGGASIIFDYTGAGSGGSPTAHDTVGDVRARFAALALSVASGDSLGRIWAGFRSANFITGTINSFANIWECGAGGGGLNGSESGITLDTTTDTTGASPGGGVGSFVKLIESDLDWDAGTPYEVCSILISNARSMLSADNDYPPNFGEFLWLLRAKVTAGTWRVHLRFGYDNMADGDFIRADPIDITATSWDYHEAAIQSIPLRDLQSIPSSLRGVGYESRLAIQIWAERIAGAGDLYLDCLCPIPIDEGYLIIKSPIDVAGAGGGALVLGESPTNNPYVIGDNGSYVVDIPTYEFYNFGPPPGDGRLIIVYARAASSDLTDYLVAASGCVIYECWASYRGAE